MSKRFCRPSSRNSTENLASLTNFLKIQRVGGIGGFQYGLAATVTSTFRCVERKGCGRLNRARRIGRSALPVLDPPACTLRRWISWIARSPVAGSSDRGSFPRHACEFATAATGRTVPAGRELLSNRRQSHQA
jgi:hypothetical protein